MEAQIVEAIRQVQHRFGSAALRQGRDALAEAACPTGVPAIDHRLACGGLPLGRVSVLAAGGSGRGPSGRLTLLQLLAASASRQAQVVYVDLTGTPDDLTGTLDPGFLADLGADLDSCLVVRPRGGDPVTGLVMARALSAAGVPWLAVGLGEWCRHPAHRAARAGGQRWDHAVGALAEAAWRSRGVVCLSAPAPLDRALAYASSLTLTCTARGWQWVHGDVAGLRVEVTTTKSKVSPPGVTETLLLGYPRPHAPAGVVSVPGIIERPTPLDRPAVVAESALAAAG